MCYWDVIWYIECCTKVVYDISSVIKVLYDILVMLKSFILNKKTILIDETERKFYLNEAEKKYTYIEPI